MATPNLIPPDSSPLSITVDAQSSPAWSNVSDLNGYPFVGTMRFPFFDVDAGFNESANPEYTASSVVGRAEQFRTYVGNANREVPMTFYFRAQGVEVQSYEVAGDPVPGAIRGEVLRPVGWLQALSNPRLYAGVWYPPPSLILVLGDLLNMRCVISSLSVRWIGPVDTVSLLPHGAEVSVGFTSVASSLANFGEFGHKFRNQGQAISAAPPTPSGLSPFSGSGSAAVDDAFDSVLDSARTE